MEMIQRAMIVLCTGVFLLAVGCSGGTPERETAQGIPIPNSPSSTPESTPALEAGGVATWAIIAPTRTLNSS